MKKKLNIILSSIVVLGVSALLAKTEKTTPQFNLNGSSDFAFETRLARLEEKVSMLEQENYSLKESIAKLESVTISPKENWKKKEFNGETYYITPATNE